MKLNYFRKLETFSFQMMEFTIFYTLSRMNYNFFPNTESKIKTRVLNTINTTKKFFMSHTAKEFKQFIDNLTKKWHSEMEDSDDGFENSDDERKKVDEQNQMNVESILVQNQKLFKKVNVPEQNISIIEEMLKKINERDNLIIQLEDKIKSREEIISKTIEGHLKDVTHMRESIYRQQGLENYEFFQVSYFDANSVLDPQICKLLNDKISQLKQLFEEKAKDFLQKIFLITNQNSNMKEQIRSLILHNKEEFTLEKLLKKAFLVESNPYRFWKAIQDIKGTSLYFFEVFENQRPSEGINYREINKMMMSSKAYEREYQMYKRKIDEQMKKFQESRIQETQNLQRELEEKKKLFSLEMLESQKNFESLKQMYQDQLKQLSEENSKLKLAKIEVKDTSASVNECAKYMLKRWVLIYRFYQHCQKVNETSQSYKNSIKKLVIDTTLVKQMKAYYKKQLKQITNSLSSMKEKFDEINLQNINQNIKLLTVETSNKNYLEKIRTLQFQQDIAEKEKSNLLMKKNLFENSYNQLMKIIMPNLLKPEQLVEERSEQQDSQIFLLKDRINQMNSSEIRLLQETKESIEKNIDAVKDIPDSIKLNIDQSTQTEIIGVISVLDVIKDGKSAIEQQQQLASQKYEKHQLELKVPQESSSSDEENEYENFKRYQKRIKNMQDKMNQTFQIPENRNPEKILQTNNQTFQFQGKPSSVDQQVSLNTPIQQDSDRQVQKISQTQYVSSSKVSREQKKIIFDLEQFRSPKIKAKKRFQSQYQHSNTEQSKEENIVFNRLFEESKTKQIRQDVLIKKAQEIEQSHWEEILSLLNHLQGINQNIFFLLGQQNQNIQQKIAQSIHFYKTKFEQVKIQSKQNEIQNPVKKKDQRNRIGRTQRELSDQFFLSIMEEPYMKKRVFLKELINEFEKQTLKIHKIPHLNPINLSGYDGQTQNTDLEKTKDHIKISIEEQRKINSNDFLQEKLKRSFRNKLC